MPDISISETYAYECLRYDWGGAYAITHTTGAVKRYSAQRRDDHAVVLGAATPDELRELIRADYMAKPVPRDVAP